jgi:hypothetical protein
MSSYRLNLILAGVGEIMPVSDAANVIAKINADLIVVTGG